MAPVKSVVIPAIGVPAATAGEPVCGARLVAELKSGSAICELAFPAEAQLDAGQVGAIDAPILPGMAEPALNELLTK